MAFCLLLMTHRSGDLVAPVHRNDVLKERYTLMKKFALLILALAAPTFVLAETAGTSSPSGSSYGSSSTPAPTKSSKHHKKHKKSKKSSTDSSSNSTNGR